jgi:transcriptional regulator with XRE-family HTH domain
MKELGEKAGLSEIYIGEIERGQKYPSSKVLESLAQALDLDIADLLQLVAEEIRFERQPQQVNAIGFTVGQPRRQVMRQMVNMLGDQELDTVTSFSAFLLSSHSQM